MRVVVYCVFVLCMFLFRFELQCTAARAHVEAESTPARPRLTEPPLLAYRPIRPSLPPRTVCSRHTNTVTHEQTRSQPAPSRFLAWASACLAALMRCAA